MVIIIPKKYNFSVNRQKTCIKYKSKKWNLMCQICWKDREILMKMMKKVTNKTLKIAILPTETKENNNFLTIILKTILITWSMIS
jgi:hypothetical protein